MASNRGYTIIELSVVLVIIAILFGLATVNVIRFQQKSYAASSEIGLISDLKHQQLRAMKGNSPDGVQQAYGVYLGSASYILFSGESYDSSDPENFEVGLPGNIQISNNTFQDSQIVFLPGSGEIKDYSDTNSSFELLNTSDNTTINYDMNMYGVIEQIQ